VEQSCEERIANPDQGTYHCNRDANDTSISGEFLLGGPGHFFHFGDYFVYELLHEFHIPLPLLQLLGFLMDRVLLAELAVLIELQTIRVVLLVLVGTVVAALALRALQGNIVAHLFLHPLRFGLFDATSCRRH
jgi:hypothetical protein